MSSLRDFYRDEGYEPHRPFKDIKEDYLLRVGSDRSVHHMLRLSPLRELALRKNEHVLYIAEQLLAGDIEEWFMALEVLETYGSPDASHVLIMSLPNVSSC